MKRREMIAGLSTACLLPALKFGDGKEYYKHVEIIRIELDNADGAVALGGDGFFGYITFVQPSTYNQTVEEYVHEKLQNFSYFHDTFKKTRYCYVISVKNKPEYVGLLYETETVQILTIQEFAEIISQPLRKPVMT